MNKAKLVILESCDSGGKSTQVEIIKKYFEEKKLSHSFFHFPMYGHNEFSKVIAKFLQGDFGKADEVDPLFVATQYAMDRFKFMPELQKELDTKDIVLLDRYVFSNIAYQCAKIEDKKERENLAIFIKELEFNFLALPYPDLNIFFDVPIEIIEERLIERKKENRDYLEGKQDIHETDIDLQQRVRLEYLKQMNKEPNCQIVECAINAEAPNGRFVWYSHSPENLFKLYQADIDRILSI
ncbi:MAG: thymidylate kinase [Clostridia bacterium]